MNEESALVDVSEEAPKNLLLIDVDKRIALLKENLEQGRLKNMKILEPLAEQESRYQRMSETLGRQKRLLAKHICELEQQNLDDLAIDQLKLRYALKHQKLYEDIIAGKVEQLKSRDHIFDKINEQLIKLERENRKVILGSLEEQIKDELSRYEENFIIEISACNSLSELKVYLNTLENLTKELNDSIFKLVEEKTPYGMEYHACHDRYVWDKGTLLGNALLEAVKQDDKVLCLILLEEYRANIDFQDKKGFSALHCAMSREMVQLLLKYKANTTLTLRYEKPRDHRGFTPLHWHTLEGHEEIVKLLLEAGAEVDARSDTGTTPLFLATKIKPNETLVELLMQYGANPRLRNNKGHFAMGPSSGHKGDKFEKMSLWVEELLADQAGKGAQALQQVKAQQKKIEELVETQKQILEILTELRQENRLLKAEIQQLQITKHNNPQQNDNKEPPGEEDKITILTTPSMYSGKFF